MTSEKLQDLRANTRIGFTAKRGYTSWHYRAGDADSIRNHFEGAVPMESVLDLMSWDAVSCKIRVEMPDTVPVPGVEVMPGLTVADPEWPTPIIDGRQAIVRSDTGAVLGIFSDGYEIHQYREWLIARVSNILGDTLAIGSAGLLKNGAQAWVTVEVPDNITTPEGVEFRPNLTACTSHDGSLATTYKRMVQLPVCDNTLAAGLGEAGQQLKIRHSKYSKLRISEARDALALVHEVAEDFMAEVAALCRVDVSDRAWSTFLDSHAPLEEKGVEKVGRARTLALNEREALTQLWNNDNRVSPWRGTGFGVLQAVNTYEHHIKSVRGVDRAERNMSNAVLGKTEASDRATVTELMAVLAR